MEYGVVLYYDNRPPIALDRSACQSACWTVAHRHAYPYNPDFNAYTRTANGNAYDHAFPRTSYCDTDRGAADSNPDRHQYTTSRRNLYPYSHTHFNGAAYPNHNTNGDEHPATGSHFHGYAYRNDHAAISGNFHPHRHGDDHPCGCRQRHANGNDHYHAIWQSALSAHDTKTIVVSERK